MANETNCDANSSSIEIALFQSSENDVEVVVQHAHSLIEVVTNEHLHMQREQWHHNVGLELRE